MNASSESGLWAIRMMVGVVGVLSLMAPGGYHIQKRPPERTVHWRPTRGIMVIIRLAEPIISREIEMRAPSRIQLACIVGAFLLVAGLAVPFTADSDVAYATDGYTSW